MNSMRELLSTRQNLCPGLGNHDSGPSVFACDQYVAPSKRRDVFEQVLWCLDACAFAFLDCASELVGVPVDDGCSEEVQSGNPDLPGNACPIPDFSLASDPMGRMFFNIVASFAEFEADLIRIRTREGMAIARAKCKLRGKQPKLSGKQQKELWRMHDTAEYSISDLAELFSVSRPTVYRTLNRRKIP